MNVSCILIADRKGLFLVHHFTHFNEKTLVTLNNRQFFPGIYLKKKLLERLPFYKRSHVSHGYAHGAGT